VTQLRAVLLRPENFFFDHYLALWRGLLAASLKLEFLLSLIEGGATTDTVICNRRVVV